MDSTQEARGKTPAFVFASLNFGATGKMLAPLREQIIENRENSD